MTGCAVVGLSASFDGKMWNEGADLHRDVVVQRPESVLFGKTNTDLKAETEATP